MAKSFKNLRARMSSEARSKAKVKADTLLKEMPLSELRQALQLTQEQLAEELHVRQAAISKLEHRTDMYISTLRKFLEAMGGELEITARFKDGSVKISQFEELEESKAGS